MGLTIEQKIDIPLIYRSTFIHNSLWAWVSAKREEGYTVFDAVRTFREYMGMHDFAVRDLYAIYCRKQQEFVQSVRKDVDRLHVRTEPKEPTTQDFDSLKASIDGLREELTRFTANEKHAGGC